MQRQCKGIASKGITICCCGELQRLTPSSASVLKILQQREGDRGEDRRKKEEGRKEELRAASASLT